MPDQTNCMLTLVVVYFASKVNEKSFLLVCYFTLDNIYEVRILFIVVLDRTTGQCPLLGNLDHQFNGVKVIGHFTKNLLQFILVVESLCKELFYNSLSI